jgi:putative MATE family efflux protein
MNSRTAVKEQNRYFKDIFVIAVPIIIQGMVFQLQVLINRAFLGNLKAEYLTAIGNATAPYQATLDAATSATMGLTILISRKMGAKDYREVHEHMDTSIFFNTLISILLFLLWFFFSDSIFLLMGVTPDLIGYCDQYVKIIGMYLLLFGPDISIQAALQGMGETKPIMYAGIYKVAMNIFLDWCLIFGNLGFPELELTGAAIASSAANISSALLLILYVRSSKKLRLTDGPRRSLRPNPKMYREAMRLGLPAGMEIVAWNVGNLFLVRLMNNLDDSAVGMYSLIMVIESITFLVSSGIGRGSLTLIGHKIGANRAEESTKIILQATLYNLGILGVLITLYILFAEPILSLFCVDRALVRASVPYFIIVCISVLPKSLNVEAGSGIRAYGDTKWMLYTQIFGAVFVAVVAYFFVYACGMDIAAIYITLLLDETVRGIINSLYLCKKYSPAKLKTATIS